MQTCFSETTHNEYNMFVRIEEKTEKGVGTTEKGWLEVPSVRTNHDVLAQGVPNFYMMMMMMTVTVTTADATEHLQRVASVLNPFEKQLI